jgi:hypothetical protein
MRGDPCRQTIEMWGIVELADARQGTSSRPALGLMKTNCPGKVQSIVAMASFVCVITAVVVEAAKQRSQAVSASG